jgi:hypothetical protein
MRQRSAVGEVRKGGRWKPSEAEDGLNKASDMAARWWGGRSVSTTESSEVEKEGHSQEGRLVTTTLYPIDATSAGVPVSTPDSSSKMAVPLPCCWPHDKGSKIQPLTDLDFSFPHVQTKV